MYLAAEIHRQVFSSLHNRIYQRQVSMEMEKLRIGLAAGAFAMIGTAITQLVQLTFIEPPIVNVAVEGLFVGTVIYFGVKTLERSADAQ